MRLLRRTHAKMNHWVDIKVNMICIFIILSWPLILHVIQKCNADSTIRTLYMLELSLLKTKMLFENCFYWWSLLDKNYFCAWCPSFKICFYRWFPLKKPGVLGWVRFFTGIALNVCMLSFDLQFPLD